MNNVTIVVGHGDPSERELVSVNLKKLGHNVRAVCETKKELFEECKDEKPQLIISGIEYPDGDGIETLIELSRDEPIPAIIVTEKTSLQKVEEAMDDHVMAYLITPVTADDLKPSIQVVLRRFAQFEELRKENKDLREALFTRKKVERAKGILMKQKGMSEEEAYLHIRDLATSSRTKMSQVAEILVQSDLKNSDES